MLYFKLKIRQKSFVDLALPRPAEGATALFQTP